MEPAHRCLGVLVLVAGVAVPSLAASGWTARADVIGESFGRGLQAAGVIGGEVYVAGGGYIGTSLWGSYSSALAYDPVANTWSFVSDMPHFRTAPAAAVSDATGSDRLYVIGGLDLTDFPLAQYAVAGIDEYDPATDSWQTVGLSLPDDGRTWGACAVTVDGTVYVMGGADASFASASSRLAAYDPSGDSFTTLASMPEGRSDGVCAAADGVIYYLGGYTSGSWGGVPSAQVLAYDIAANSWRTAATPMPVPRVNAAAVADGAGILVVGGWDGSGQYGGLYSSVDLYLPGLDAWVTDALPPLGCVPDDGSSVRGRSGLTLEVASNGATDLLYAVGGNVGISLPTRCNESTPLPVLDLLFADDFEMGDTVRWATSVP